MKKSIGSYLDQVRDTDSRIAIESFYNYCKGRILLEDLGVSSWRLAVKRLVDYENFYKPRGEVPKRYESLISSYEAWRALGES